MGECACPAQAVDECICRDEGWKTGDAAFAKFLRIYVVTVTMNSSFLAKYLTIIIIIIIMVGVEGRPEYRFTVRVGWFVLRSTATESAFI